jgi:hypothetical protein
VVQLALNVADLDEANDSYLRLFDTAPSKVRPGYANFASSEPPLKLVLVEGAGDPASINHLGVEVATAQDVAAARSCLGNEGMKVVVEEHTTCCCAVQNKVWADGPDGAHWEWYTALADADSENGLDGDGRCCPTPSPRHVAGASSTPSLACL